jgi:hypothetical protein
MTTPLVLRLDEKRAEQIEQVARKRQKAKKGVRWAEHFEWMKTHGRKIDWYPESDFRNR